MTESAPAPRAAIVIPAYNAEGTLARALDSALAQSADVEIIVVDDCSKDGTAALADAYAARDARVRAIRQAINQGPAAARNAAIAASSAPWIALLDADDFMAPDRIGVLLERAEREALDFLADDLFKVDSSDIDGPRSRLWSAENFGALVVDFATFIRGNLPRGAERREMGFIKPLMRRAFLDAHDLRYADMRLGEDYDLYARALLRGARFRLVDPAGYVAVTRAESLSGAHSTADHAAMVAADLRLRADPALDAEGRAALEAHLARERRKWAWRRLIDAVRERDPAEALRCFAGPPGVSAFLIGQLLDQARLRAGRLLGFAR